MNQLSEDMMEPDVYLIPDFEEHKDVKGWIRRNYDAVFRNILFGVYTNEAMWPQNRTYDLFCKWVDFSSHLMVWELNDFRVAKQFHYVPLLQHSILSPKEA